MKGQSSMETIFLSIGIFIVLLLIVVVSHETNIRSVEYSKMQRVRDSVFRISDAVNIANFTESGFYAEVYVDEKLGSESCFLNFFPGAVQFSCGLYRKAAPVFSVVENEGNIDNFTIPGGNIRVSSEAGRVIVENV